MEENEKLNSREIKKYIMDVSQDLEELIEYLEIDYQSTAEGVFNAIFTLMRHYEQNKSRVDYLIDLIKSTVSLKSSEEVKCLSGMIIDLNNKIENWKLKDKIKVKEPLEKIQEILLEVDRTLSDKIKNKKIKYLSFLIFEERNIYLIENTLQESSGILHHRDSNGDNIFTIILKKYLLLEEKNTEDIEYYYHIIMLFMNSKYRREIVREKENYLHLIQQSKLYYKEHIIRVLELFNPNFSITLDKLEERYHVSFSFPPSILDEIKTFQMNNMGRVNFLNQDCITIDGENSLCLDDAVFLEKNLDGTYTLYVHIMDIPSFVPIHSITDLEARKRAETLYLKGRKLTLYPEYICDVVCSLLANNHRNVITSIFHLDSDFHVIEDEFLMVPGKIQVRNNLTYHDADMIIRNENTAIGNQLRNLSNFAYVSKNGNTIRRQYREYQNIFVFDPNHESLKMDVSPSASIVHELMVLTNYKAAKYAKDNGYPFIYREIDLPSDVFLREQISRIKTLEPNFLSEKELLQRFREGYTRGIYTEEPKYHRGQNTECYSHFTSPGRRYADGFNQYIFHDLVVRKNLSDANVYKWEYLVKEVVYHLNKKRQENEMFASHYNYLASKNLIRKK